MRRQPECLAVKSVLVLPEYWGTGVSVLLFDELARRARAKGYKWADLSLTSADNPYTPTLAERGGAKVYKRYRVTPSGLATVLTVGAGMFGIRTIPFLFWVTVS